MRRREARTVSDEGIPSLTLRFFMGIAFAAAGIFPILVAFDVGPFESRTINGPPWIGVAAGAVFLSGALYLFLYDAATRYPWLGNAFAFLIVAAFAALMNWIAFGPGPRECSGTFSFAMFTSARWVQGLECRTAFGLGAMMCDGLLLMIAGRSLTQLGVANAVPALLDKSGTWLMFAAFAPLLLIFAVATLAREGARWLRSRIP